MLKLRWAVLSVCVLACDTDFAEPTPSAPPSGFGRVPPAFAGSDAPMPAGPLPEKLTCVWFAGDADRDAGQDADAGPSDACSADFDADGCSNVAQHYLGGCADPHNAVLTQRCGGTETRREVSYVLPAADSAFRSVWLQPSEAGLGNALEVRALAVTPAGSATVRDSDFTTVKPGATLRFELILHNRPSIAITRAQLRLVADARVVGEGELLITPLPNCSLRQR